MAQHRNDDRMIGRHYLAAMVVALFLLGVVAVLIPVKADAAVYGGCKEAYTMPHSDMAKVCSGRQYLRMVEPRNQVLCHMENGRVPFSVAKRVAGRLADGEARITRWSVNRWWVPSIRPKVHRMGRVSKRSLPYLRAAEHAHTPTQWYRGMNGWVRITQPNGHLADQIRRGLDLAPRGSC